MRLIGLAIVLAVSFFLAPLAGEAQPAGRIWRIGYLSLVSGELEQSVSRSIFSAGQVERLPALAAELGCGAGR